MYTVSGSGYVAGVGRNTASIRTSLVRLARIATCDTYVASSKAASPKSTMPQLVSPVSRLLCPLFHLQNSKYRVIHKSFRDFRPLRYSSRDGHAEGENLERFSTYWYAPFCCFCLGCWAAEFENSGGTYELPCISTVRMKAFVEMKLSTLPCLLVGMGWFSGVEIMTSYSVCPTWYTVIDYNILFAYVIPDW